MVNSPSHISRLERTASLYKPSLALRFVEAGRAKLLEKLGCLTVSDVLWHIPSRYIDMSEIIPIKDASNGDITVVGEITEVIVKKPRPKLNVTEVLIHDGTAPLVGVWFNQPWIQHAFKVGDTVAFSGSVKFEYGMRRISNPFTDILEPGALSYTGVLHAIYPTTEQLSQGWLRKIIRGALADYGWPPDPLPASIRRRVGVASLGWALQTIHQPPSNDGVLSARNALAFHELFFHQLLFAYRHHLETVDTVGHAHIIEGDIFPVGTTAFGFSPTAEQAKAIEELLGDMKSPHPMTRMLLGDVGTGKTMVACFGFFAVAASGTQAAMMAPTEVLAQQYARKIGPILDACGISWALVTGSTRAAEKNAIKKQVQDGEITVLFGTHALIEHDVHFNKLTYVVIDEQHRFGVAQRQALCDKGESPDVLVMSATPIPRTLAISAYGNLDLSVITKRPVEGAGVSTRLIKPRDLQDAYEATHEAVAAGHQVYVICALVEDSTEGDLVAAQVEAERLAKYEYHNLRVELLTGRMTPSAKQEVMQRFVEGEIDVLVATTVVEVGVDVPNATQMIILNAERFGLAQLHQLRGRVGRGKDSGEVWLVSDSFADESKRRFDALVRTTDGFEIAQLDLELRGAGDVLGKRQHGYMQFKVADIVCDAPLVERARAEAFALIESDPHLADPKHVLINRVIQRQIVEMQEWVVAG